MVFNYLKENAPDISKYEYRDWTAETTQFVNECIQIYSNPQATIQAMSAAGAATAPVQAAPAAAQAAMTPQAMPAAPVFSAPSMPEFSAPSMGLASAPSATDPRGFDPAAMSGLDGVLGTTPTPSAPSAPSAPSMGMNLDDILAGQIVG